MLTITYDVPAAGFPAAARRQQLRDLSHVAVPDMIRYNHASMYVCLHAYIDNMYVKHSVDVPARVCVDTQRHVDWVIR